MGDGKLTTSHWLGELLAVIHGDGGHHQDEHGTEESARRAMERWYLLQAEVDRLRASQCTVGSESGCEHVNALRAECDAAAAEALAEVARLRAALEKIDRDGLPMDWWPQDCDEDQIALLAGAEEWVRNKARAALGGE